MIHMAIFIIYLLQYIKNYYFNRILSDFNLKRHRFYGNTQKELNTHNFLNG
jgi:hypothetical protein